MQFVTVWQQVLNSCLQTSFHQFQIQTESVWNKSEWKWWSLDVYFGCDSINWRGWTSKDLDFVLYGIKVVTGLWNTSWDNLSGRIMVPCSDWETTFTNFHQSCLALKLHELFSSLVSMSLKQQTQVLFTFYESNLKTLLAVMRWRRYRLKPSNERFVCNENRRKWLMRLGKKKKQLAKQTNKDFEWKSNQYPNQIWFPNRKLMRYECRH